LSPKLARSAYNKMSVWELIVSDKFEEACAQADHEVSATGSKFELGNKMIALLKLGRFGEAEAICTRFCEDNIRYKTTWEWMYLGVSRWLQQNRAGAIQAWSDAASSKFFDAAGGVDYRMALLYAALSEGLADLELRMRRELRQFARVRAWPGPLAGFVSGMVSEADVLENVEPRIAALRARQSCQAEFCLGICETAESKKLEHFWRAAMDCGQQSYLEPEHHLAAYEFKRGMRGEQRR
jgi:hypothetical protein